jgi:putative aldouronate transport system substrate-binding protein
MSMNSKLRSKSVGISMSLLLVSLAIMSGCTSGANAPAPTSKETDKGTAKKGEVSIGVRGTIAMDASEGTPDNNRWTKWIQEHAPSNVKFQYIPKPEEQQNINVLFAANNAPDVIYTPNKNIKNSLYSQKQLLPLDDLIEKHSIEYKQLLQKYPLLKKLGMKDDGKMYEIGNVFGLQVNWIVLVRADWLKKLQLKAPDTTEDLFNVAKAFAEKDPDGNGQKDTFGYSLSYTGGFGINNMFQNVAWVIENGEIVRDWERAKAATELKKRMFDAGFVDKDFLADKTGATQAKAFAAGKLGIWIGSVVDFRQTTKSLWQNEPNAEVEVIQMPASTYGRFAPAIDIPFQTRTVINRRAKDPEAVIKFIDFITKESTQKILTAGIEGEHTKTDSQGCPRPIDANKYDKEISYAVDYRIAGSEYDVMKACTPVASSDPQANKLNNMMEQAKKLYLTDKAPIADAIPGAWSPPFPDNIQLIVSNTTTPINDAWNKAIVSGNAYTTEQAMKDAKSIWEKGGGKQVEDWYKKWYQDNKATYPMTKDVYSLK